MKKLNYEKKIKTVAKEVPPGISSGSGERQSAQIPLNSTSCE